MVKETSSLFLYNNDLFLKKNREVILQMLYSIDMGTEIVDSSSIKKHDIINLITKTLLISKKKAREALNETLLIWNNRSNLDNIIAASSNKYSVSNIPCLEKNVLRLAIYYFFDSNFLDQHKVVITEAIRLIKKFGNPTASSFINAVLDNVYINKNNFPSFI